MEFEAPDGEIIGYSRFPCQANPPYLLLPKYFLPDPKAKPESFAWAVSRGIRKPRNLGHAPANAPKIGLGHLG